MRELKNATLLRPQERGLRSATIKGERFTYYAHPEAPCPSELSPTPRARILPIFTSAMSARALSGEAARTRRTSALNSAKTVVG
jgi:hypothetical protein